MTTTLNAPTTIRLTALRAGQRAVIRETRLEPDDAALLRAMGLCLNATVRVFRIGEPCVLAVGGVNANCKCGGMCRVGLARPLAEKILVEVVG
jgi:Fe2+ transport system protein FeoA